MDNTASCMIEVCDLHKHYKDVHVLRGISTTVAKGEVCAVIGPSGSGKSTFLRCLNRLEEASSGEIFINAQEITDPHLNLNKMRENIGMVFQGFNLIPSLDAAENVELPLLYRGIPRAERRQLSRRALQSVGLENRLHHLPSQMSGGQQQRVAVARAIAASPPVLLADEPTGNLDSRSGAEVMGILRRLNGQGKTVVLITHDPGIAGQAGRTVTIQDGRIVS